MNTQQKNQHNDLPLDAWRHDPFWRMPQDLPQRDFDLLFDFSFALQSWLMDKYPHRLHSDIPPWPDDDPPDEGDDSIPY